MKMKVAVGNRGGAGFLRCPFGILNEGVKSQAPQAISSRSAGVVGKWPSSRLLSRNQRSVLNSPTAWLKAARESEAL